MRFLTYPFLRSGERSEKMPVFRVSKNRDFTVIANSIFKDRRLSAKAKGILVEMLSLPENWDYTLKGLTTLFSDGIDSIRQGIKELEENGYIVRERKRDARGRLGGMEYVIYETPHKAVENSPESAEPITGDLRLSISPFYYSLGMRTRYVRLAAVLMLANIL